MASSSTSKAKAIPDSPITESFCLLSPSSLPILEVASDGVVFLQYPRFDTPAPDPCGTRRGRGQVDRTVDIGPGGTVSRSSTTQLPETEETMDELKSAEYEVWPWDWDIAQGWESKKTLWVEAEDSGGVKILYIPRLEQRIVEAVIEASCPDVKYSDLGDLLKPHNNTQPPLITGLRLRTTSHVSSGPESLVLFLGIPYLASDPPDSEGSPTLTLSQYHNPDKLGSKDNGIRVWQAWHILFDNNRIALFKSPDRPPTASPPSAGGPLPTIKTLFAPLFPFQERLGAPHTLTQLTGNIFLHEDTVLHRFKERVDEEGEGLLAGLEEIKIAAIKNFNNQVKSPKKVKNSNEQVKKFNEEVKKFDERLKDLSRILKVIADQLKILKDFQRILDNHLPPSKSYAARNAVRLPTLDNQKEQIRATLRVLEALVTERTEKITTLKEWKLELREMQKGWQMELQEMRKGQHTDASLDTAREMKGILARQGQTVTVFTLITAAFLPLNFFATYLGMNSGVWSGVNTHEKFWRITGPITVVLVGLLSYFMFRNDDDIKADLFKLNIFNPAWWGSRDKPEGDGVEAAEEGVSGGGGLGGTSPPPAQSSTLGSSAGPGAAPGVGPIQRSGEATMVGKTSGESSNNPPAPVTIELGPVQAVNAAN